MNACIAILAHEKAAPTIADFQPQWMRLGLPLLAFLPEGDNWPGAPVSRIVNYGQNAHRGFHVYDRFMNCVETLLKTEYELFVVMEYDTVNLVDSLPVINAMAVNAALLEAFGEGVEKGQILALSPWIMTRPMAAALLEALRTQLKKRECLVWIDGLLDRWIGVALQKELVPYSAIQKSIPWCDDRWNMIKLISEDESAIVHGYKSKDKFQHLWPIH